jgi:hypothetical protein
MHKLGIRQADCHFINCLDQVVRTVSVGNRILACTACCACGTTLETLSIFFIIRRYLLSMRSGHQNISLPTCKPLKSHGVWSGVRPFVETGTSADGHVAVVTRATIKPIKLAYFWSKVAGVSKSIELYKGKRFSVGIGEWPLIQQATFSIWDNHEAMTDYAYKNPMHQKVIKLTRAKGWYKEELFARFKPFQIEGVWDGRSVDFLN